MKMISIPEAEYNQLQEEVNSLRELVRQFVIDANKLLPGKKGAVLSPKIREVNMVAKMSQKEKIEHFKRKYQ